MNAEFQELIRQYSICNNEEEKVRLLSEMKSNLIARNNNQINYTFGYISSGIEKNIQDADYTDLLSINGDMNPLGL